MLWALLVYKYPFIYAPSSINNPTQTEVSTKRYSQNSHNLESHKSFEYLNIFIATMSLSQSNLSANDDFSSLFRLLNDYDHHRTVRRQPTPRTFNPRFDIRESKDSYHLDGELPGIAQNDIEIEFSDPQTLVVKGRIERSYNTEPQNQTENDSSDAVAKNTETKENSKSDSKSTYWASERLVGKFLRTFSFGQRVNQDAVKASLKNGILSISVPKAAVPTSKKIIVE